MNSFDYSIRLQFRHPVMHPEMIASGLSLEAQFVHVAGQPRKTPNGIKTGGVYKQSYVCTHSVDGTDGRIAETISEWLDRLEPAYEFLQEFRRTGGTVNFNIFWYPNGDTGAVFDACLLDRIIKLGLDLGINVYDDRVPVYGVESRDAT